MSRVFPFKTGYDSYAIILLSKYTLDKSTVMSCASVRRCAWSLAPDLEPVVIAFSLKIRSSSYWGYFNPYSAPTGAENTTWPSMEAGGIFTCGPPDGVRGEINSEVSPVPCACMCVCVDVRACGCACTHATII